MTTHKDELRREFTRIQNEMSELKNSLKQLSEELAKNSRLSGM
jgi:predicted nuclease with TOPRIM domain